MALGGGLAALRMLFGALLMAPFMILFVLLFISDEFGSPTPALAALVIALGVAGIMAASWTSRKTLVSTSAASLANSYRTNFFLGFALSESPLLVSFVLCFTVDEMWPYVLELPFFLVAMKVIAPTEGNLDRRQREVQAQGSPLSLKDALETELAPG